MSNGVLDSDLGWKYVCVSVRGSQFVPCKWLHRWMIYSLLKSFVRLCVSTNSRDLSSNMIKWIVLFLDIDWMCLADFDGERLLTSNGHVLDVYWINLRFRSIGQVLPWWCLLHSCTLRLFFFHYKLAFNWLRNKSIERTPLHFEVHRNTSFCSIQMELYTSHWRKEKTMQIIRFR